MIYVFYYAMIGFVWFAFILFYAFRKNLRLYPGSLFYSIYAWPFGMYGFFKEQITKKHNQFNVLDNNNRNRDW